MNSLKLNNGVTIISLIITVIVLLILAGVTVSMLMGESGIINAAQTAADKYREAELYEQNVVMELENYMYSKTSRSNNNNDNNEEEEDEENTTVGGQWTDTKGVNAPKLDIKSMIPIKWNETEGKWQICSKDDEEWYNYKTETVTTSAGTTVGAKRWANVMLSDGTYKVGVNATIGTLIDTTATDENGKRIELGSMFVWIPRFAYKISNSAHSSSAGDIQIEFLQGTSRTGNSAEGYANIDSNGNIKQVADTTTPNWIIHPSFLKDTSIGGWSEDLTGYWVAKFEASQSNSKIRVVPNATPWTSIEEASIFEKCITMGKATYQLSKASSSHQMKNSEWGAVTYLAHSAYGRNGAKVSINNRAITGCSGGTKQSASSSDDTYTYETAQGVLASTTGNQYGVYDMSGGVYEVVAGALEGKVTIWDSVDAKYYNIYKKSGDGSDIKSNYEENKSKYGDAIYETSSEVDKFFSFKAWYGNFSSFIYEKWNPIILRGGSFESTSSAGLFAFTSANLSSGTSMGFRPAIVVE